MELWQVVIGVAVYVIAILLPSTKGHPQCLDFRPPFKAESGLGFCSHYQDFTCCTAQNDKAVQENYEHILRQVDQNVRQRCRDYLKSILCLECDPYVAHLYSYEETLQKKPFPGLCRGYCGTFYQQCKIIIPFITANPSVISAVDDGESAFCKVAEVIDIDYCYPDLLTNPTLTGEILNSQSNDEDCLCLEPFADQLRNPLLFLTIPGDPLKRIFIAEQIGVVHIYDKDGTKRQTPFLDITDNVLTSSYIGDERGFLGMAFHPNYLTNGKLYVYYTIRRPSDNSHVTRISQFLVSSEDENRVDRNSHKIILEQKQPYYNHNGGMILFGKDGYLYIFKGDGGAAGDPQDFSQNLNTFLGKALRIDVDVREGSVQLYTVPPDNPFLNLPDALKEIYAYGIRNPWRCDVDEGDPETGADAGRIICGDVGQNRYEEIDIIEKGGNYGWKAREGNECYGSDPRCGRLTDEVMPIYVHNHTVMKSITGGHVYRGCLSPSLSGKYIYGDFVSGRLFKLTEHKSNNTWTSKQVKMCGNDICFNGLTGSYPPNILSFGEDEDGEIYMLTTNIASTTSPDGKVYKIVDPRRRGDPAKCRSNKLKSEATTIPTTGPIITTNQGGSTRNPTKEASALSWGSDANLNELYLAMIYQQYLYHNMPQYQQRYYQEYWDMFQQYAS